MGFFMSGGFEIMFFLMFSLVIGMFILTVIRGISQWNKNNHSPRLTVEATVVAKREEVTHHQHNTGNQLPMRLSTSTWYYVTFQVESGDRMELGVGGYRVRNACGRRFGPADIPRYAVYKL